MCTSSICQRRSVWLLFYYISVQARFIIMEVCKMFEDAELQKMLMLLLILMGFYYVPFILFHYCKRLFSPYFSLAVLTFIGRRMDGNINPTMGWWFCLMDSSLQGGPQEQNVPEMLFKAHCKCYYEIQTKINFLDKPLSVITYKVQHIFRLLSPCRGKIPIEINSFYQCREKIKKWKYCFILHFILH